MPALTPRHEAFCQAFAALANGAAAARGAGYAPANAAHQAVKLLCRAEVTERLADLRALDAARRAEETRALIDKLEPVYGASLEAGDHDCVLQVVELRRPATVALTKPPSSPSMRSMRMARTRVMANKSPQKPTKANKSP